MNNLTNQQKGSLMAFIGVMFITPDSLLIRLSNIDTWGMLFYRGAIPFVVVLIGLLFFYKIKEGRLELPQMELPLCKKASPKYQYLII